MLGIGGTGMGSLARLLVDIGHSVTGTDGKIYPPMSDQLSELGIEPFEGYDAANIDRANPDLVIIGNVIRSENPEAVEVLRQKLSVKSMPSAIEDIFLGDKTPLVIAGTHGKTTLTSLIAWLLESAEMKPGFMVGGVPLNFKKSARPGEGPHFVIEGDEYDSAFFDKGPKFLHYRPEALILTSIEFDHADIYQNLEHILKSFRQLIAIMPPAGIIIANGDDERITEIVKNAPCRVITYGLSGDAMCHPTDIEISDKGTSFKLSGLDNKFRVPMWGKHNLMNVTAALSLLTELGIEPEKLAMGLLSFLGVKRRQETIYDDKGVTIIEDFAHHPTAVGKTIEAMKMRFPDRKVWAIFEPRSNTSRRNIFQEEFAEALSKADHAIIAGVHRAAELKPDERLKPDEIVSVLNKHGIDAHHISDTKLIIEHISRGIKHGDVILIMSNGGFDGLPSKLVDAMAARQTSIGSESKLPTKGMR
jgi:UDP-N-acetylmuramate: L-alanyl-gamma-D-glutamyl-meso-diaminopimelate ligase